MQLLNKWKDTYNIDINTVLKKAAEDNKKLSLITVDYCGRVFGLWKSYKHPTTR